MYESFFGLEREPFSVAPDARFLYPSDQHREALAYLAYGLQRGGGFVLLTGGIGTGKTTVYRQFIEQLPGDIDVAYIANPKLGVTALLTRVCEDLGVDMPADGTLNDPIDAIHGHLLLAHARGRRALVVVDEAQVLSIDVLEQLRLLTNLVVGDRKLLQMLLIGQPELRDILEEPALEPVAQRIVARFHLSALSAGETVQYVAHRLAVAGLAGPSPFDADAVDAVHRLCRGVPRRINVLCDRSLFAAHRGGRARIDAATVERAAIEVFGRPRPVAAVRVPEAGGTEAPVEALVAAPVVAPSSPPAPLPPAAAETATERPPAVPAPVASDPADFATTEPAAFPDIEPAAAPAGPAQLAPPAAPPPPVEPRLPDTAPSGLALTAFVGAALAVGLLLVTAFAPELIAGIAGVDHAPAQPRR